MLMTKSNRGFFSNQGDATLRLKIRSGQFSNPTEISSMSTLSASFRNIDQNRRSYDHKHFSTASLWNLVVAIATMDFHENLRSSMPHQRHAIDE